MKSEKFQFRGKLPESKSILNRLLIIQSHALEYGVEEGSSGSEFVLRTHQPPQSEADDVVKMRRALEQLKNGEVADCGAAGTTLRFLGLRASRIPGTHRLSGSARLFERPHEEIGRILQQFGCEIQFGSQEMVICTEGWKIPEAGIIIDRSISSQFASAVLLNAWQLDADLVLNFDLSGAGDRAETSSSYQFNNHENLISKTPVSEGYFSMTMELVRRAGMKVHASEGGKIVVPACSRIHAGVYTSEIDVSSAFAVAALAVANGGQTTVQHWPDVPEEGLDSLQPDRVFPEILRRMGAEVSIHRDHDVWSLMVRRDSARALKPIQQNLLDAPDLFPVLAVLCAFADGTSRLFGAPHLVHKESDRVGKIVELLSTMGRRCKRIHGGLEIEGHPEIQSATHSPHGSEALDEAPIYSTDHDHRLAMAAAVALAGGCNIQIRGREVVAKSFPDFWSIMDGQK
jgi:3-phosphoshikimate 1-carboxyvinyltransferase